MRKEGPVLYDLRWGTRFQTNGEKKKSNNKTPQTTPFDYAVEPNRGEGNEGEKVNNR
jgi:hypothetical protein